MRNPQSLIPEEREVLPLSLLNDFLYCPRRAALKLVEGWRGTNEHTLRGDIVHEHADLAGYESLRRSESPNLRFEIVIWRALPVWSERLGLSGRCDIVESEAAPESEIRNPRAEANPKPEDRGQRSEDRGRRSEVGGRDLKPETRTLDSGALTALRPVEFKLGKRRQWENDDVQLCAQALCLEEMFGVPVSRGAVFHAKSKRRREVEFTTELRQQTEQAIADLHAMIRPSATSDPKPEIRGLPPAVWKPACEECSLFNICLPAATGPDSPAARLARQLFEI